MKSYYNIFIVFELVIALFFGIGVKDYSTIAYASTIVETVDVGNAPWGVAVNPETNMVYVANEGDGTLSVIYGEINSVIDNIDIGGPVRELAVNPETNIIYVISEVGNMIVIDGETDSVVDDIFVGFDPLGVTVNPETNIIYVTSRGAVAVIDGDTNFVIEIIPVGIGITGVGANSQTNIIYVADAFNNTVTIIDGVNADDDDNDSGYDDEKSFTFKCRQHSLIAGKRGIFEKMILDLGENEQCTVTLTNLEPGVPIEFSTFLRTGRSTSIQLSPENGVTDANGQMEFTISAIEKGSDWIAWAVRNDKGEFEFNKSAYNNGTAWGMFVEVD